LNYLTIEEAFCCVFVNMKIDIGLQSPKIMSLLNNY